MMTPPHFYDQLTIPSHLGTLHRPLMKRPPVPGHDPRPDPLPSPHSRPEESRHANADLRRAERPATGPKPDDSPDSFEPTPTSSSESLCATTSSSPGTQNMIDLDWMKTEVTELDAVAQQVAAAAELREGTRINNWPADLLAVGLRYDELLEEFFGSGDYGLSRGQTAYETGADAMQAALSAYQAVELDNQNLVPCALETPKG